MAQFINTNIAALDSQRNLNASQMALQTSLQRLSSGLRVNSAKDDAAGLAIAERMTSQVTGLNMAARNANDAISLSQTAEGALAAVGTNLQRMRELAVQASNATASTGDQQNLNNEYDQLSKEIYRVLVGTKFNGVQLLNSTATLQFQVGADSVLTSATNKIDVALADLTTGAGMLKVSAGAAGAGTGASATDVLWAAGTVASVNVATAQTAIDDLSLAIDEVTAARSTFGAAQNRFTSTIANLQIASQNQASARSRIMDTDFAQETSALTRAQILQQAGTAMLAQANSSNNGVMALLR